ncbi:MAG: nucleotidyltransferase family protein [Cytophagales bacterium]
MLSKNEILNRLRTVKEALHTIGVIEIGLFGSYSMDAGTVNSDIDILIDFDPAQETYDHLLASCAILENAFVTQTVDIVTKNGLSKWIKPYILQQVIYV